MPENHGRQWWPQVINASDNRCWWLKVMGAINGSIFMSTTSCFRLAAWELWNVPQKCKKLCNLQDLYRSDWASQGCKLNAWCFAITSFFFFKGVNFTEWIELWSIIINSCVKHCSVVYGKPNFLRHFLELSKERGGVDQSTNLLRIFFLHFPK